MVRPPRRQVVLKQTRFRNRLLLILCPALIAATGCSDQGSAPSTSRSGLLQVSIHQGIAGRIWFWEGDFMPMSPTGTITPAVRTVFVYTATPTDSAIRAGDGGFYSSVLTRFVGVTSSNDSGFFQISLPPGRYSLFVGEDSLFYANSFDGTGTIQPVAVASDSITTVNINITYRATF